MWPSVSLEGVCTFTGEFLCFKDDEMFTHCRCDGRQRPGEVRQEWGCHVVGLMGLFFWGMEPGIYPLNALSLK